MLKGSGEIDGFHNSNHLYRGKSIEKMRNMESSYYSRSPGICRRHNMVQQIEGFENETYSR